MIQFKNLTHHTIFYLTLSKSILQVYFVNRFTNLLFMAGKAVRLFMSLTVIVLISRELPQFGTINSELIIIVFITYQLLDQISQILFRNVYDMSYLIRTGNFDFYLCQPINVLFRSLMGAPDINDIIFFLPSTAVLLSTLWIVDFRFLLFDLFLYFCLLALGFLISASFHIIILAATIYLVQADSLIWLYRDFSRLGQIPLDFFFPFLRFLFLFVLPIGIMTTLPAQVLLNQPPVVWPILSIIICFIFGAFSLYVWKKAIIGYSSASS